MGQFMYKHSVILIIVGTAASPARRHTNCSCKQARIVIGLVAALSNGGIL